MNRYLIGVLALVSVGLPTFVIAQNEAQSLTVVGGIHFSAPANWKTVDRKFTTEQTVYMFHIPNAADAGTSSSSDLSFIATTLKTDQDRGSFWKRGSTPRHIAEDKKLVEGWTCSNFFGKQESTQTLLTFWDCYRVIGNSGLFVRAAWPDAPDDPPDYEKNMEATLSAFLISVGR